MNKLEERRTGGYRWDEMVYRRAGDTSNAIKSVGRKQCKAKQK